MTSFPFLEPPDARSVKDGIALLEELGALRDGRLTKLGRRLAELPLDPRLGRMVLEAERLGCAHDVMVIAAALSIQDPRERPADDRQKADELHARFHDDASDFVAILNLWDHLRDEQKHLSSSQFRKRCKAEYLNWLRVREWQDVYSQLLQVVRGQKVHVNRDRADPDTVHRALLPALLSHIGLRIDDGREYRGARATRFVLSPGSSLARKRPRWVMAAELVETNRLWAHTAARVRPEWIESAAGELVTRTYTDPHWDPGRGAAHALEHVSLFGLPVVTGRRIPLHRVDPDLARRLFLEHALFLGEWQAPHEFLAHNRKLLDELRELEDRARRHDLVVDDDVLLRFYDERVPDDVVSARHFDRWWRDEQRRRPELLSFTPELLLDGAVDPGAYPDTWPVGDTSFPLSYAFEPGAAHDGVTVDVPLAAVPRLRDDAFEWQVPGLRLELVSALLRTLPKPLRRNVTPVNDAARAFLAEHGPDDGRLVLALARFAGVAPSQFRPGDLPEHLRMRVRVVDDRGRALATGRDIDTVRRQVNRHIRDAVRRAGHAVERTGITSWDLGELPRTVDLRWRGVTITGHPALVDAGDTVAIQVFASPGEQEAAMWEGTRRLLLLTIPSPRKALRDRLTNHTKAALSYAPHAGPAELLDDCITAAVDLLLRDNGGPVWDGVAFDALRDAVRAGVGATAVGVVAAVGRILTAAHDIDVRLGRITSPAAGPAIADIHVQLARLVHPGFVTATGASRLPDILRYLTAVERRIDKLVAEPGRDAERMRVVQRLDDRLLSVRRHEDVQRLRWLIEELRVSLWAQQLGTRERVSEARLVREIEAASRP